jgi:hypothetical protein
MVRSVRQPSGGDQLSVPDEVVEAPTCVSNIHVPPVPATVRGTWAAYQNLAEKPGIWYCEKCAQTGEAFRLFKRDKVEDER